MVIYRTNAKLDLEDILYGLLTWKKHYVSEEQALDYIDDIKNACDALDKIAYHFDTKYEDYLQHGDKVFAYKRNSQTTWYIIYDIDDYKNIYINKITSNYVTKM